MRNTQFKIKKKKQTEKNAYRRRRFHHSFYKLYISTHTKAKEQNKPTALSTG